MEHAKKMVVVPQELIERLREGSSKGSSSNKPNASLDAEMHRILSDKRLDDTEKWKQYQQVLQRFLHFSMVKRQPIGLSIIDDEGGEDTAGSIRRESAALLEEVVETFPKIYKTEARSLLRFMNRQGSPITWDAQGVVHVNGEIIPDSNIVDIMHSVVRVRKVDRLPPGWHNVMTVLKNMNVPKEYVGNPAARRFLGVGPDTVSSPTTVTSSFATSTPMPPLRKTPMLDRLRPRSPRPSARRRLITGEEAADEKPLDFILDNWEQFP